jgi:hypothetical protein
LTGRVQLLGCQVEQALPPARSLEQEREQPGLRIADDTEDLGNLPIGKRGPPAFLPLWLADGLGRVVLQVAIGDRDIEQPPAGGDGLFTSAGAADRGAAAGPGIRTGVRRFSGGSGDVRNRRSSTSAAPMMGWFSAPCPMTCASREKGSGASMTTRRWHRKVIAIVSAVAAAAVFPLVSASAAQADSLRPLTVTLTCTNNGYVGLPYGYQITTGSGLYYPPARSDASVSGNAKTFYLLMPTTATSLGVNTWCNGFQQTAVWSGYITSITPGTSTVNAAGNCNTYSYTVYPGGTFNPTFCTLTSISYS